MRLYLAFLAALLAGCTKENGPQRLDFVNTTRYTSSNRVGLNPADTLASRVFAENTDKSGPNLGRLVVTVRYQPRRNPFLYPTPISSISRDSIDKSAENFVYLDSALVQIDPATGKTMYPTTFLLTNTFGIRTTTGSERWQYDLYNSSSLMSGPTATRAVTLGMRRTDSTAVVNDYLLRLVIPAVGVDPTVRAKSTRRFLHLRAGLALPAYTVLKSGAPGDAQAVAQRLTDLVILPDGLTLISPELFTTNTTMWPVGNQRATRIYATRIAVGAFTGAADDAAIRSIYNAVASTATTTGQTASITGVDQIFAFRTDERQTPTGGTTPYRYGLLRVVSIPTSTTTTSTAGLQLQVRMGK
jgi:hypothetical protein